MHQMTLTSVLRMQTTGRNTLVFATYTNYRSRCPGSFSDSVSAMTGSTVRKSSKHLRIGSLPGSLVLSDEHRHRATNAGRWILVIYFPHGP